MVKETPEQKTIRYLKRTPLNEVRETYFNTNWDSYKQLMNYFKESGWTRGELLKADRPTGRGDARFEKRILYWYLHAKPNYYDPIPEQEIKEFEAKIQNNLPTFVVTAHGSYVSDVLYNPTFKRLLKCVKESLYVNRDPDHCGIGRLPEVNIFNDGGPNKDITYQIIAFSMDS